MFNRKLFGLVLRVARRYNEDSLRRVSEITGVSITTLHRYEQREIKTSLYIDNVFAVCHNYLNLPVDVFSADALSLEDLEKIRHLRIFTALTRFLPADQVKELTIALNNTNNLTSELTDTKE